MGEGLAPGHMIWVLIAIVCVIGLLVVSVVVLSGMNANLKAAASELHEEVSTLKETAKIKREVGDVSDKELADSLTTKPRNV
jgi:uncharacterized membrane protein